MNEVMAIIPTLAATEARLNLTYAGSNGDLPDPIHFDAADSDVKTWATEAIRTGGVPGIHADTAVDLTDFVVDRFAANEARPWNLIQVRPKTAFGAKSSCVHHFHPHHGTLLMVIRPGNIVQSCCKCGEMRQICSSDSAADCRSRPRVFLRA